jgi:GPH family glycoside/pentoside/hexuronide:cation symporter
MTVTAERLPRGLKMGHGLGAGAMGVKETGLTTFFMLYYNQVLGFDPRVISVVLIISMFVDAVVDPSIGRLSDRTRSRWGRRLPWLYHAALPMAISWTLLWLTREPTSLSAILLLFNVIAVRLFVSACEIPALSLMAELTQDYDERTGLARYRFLFGWLAGLVATSLAYGYFLVDPSGESQGLLYEAGYWHFGLFGAGLILVTTLGSALIQHKRVANLTPTIIDHHDHSLWQDIRLAFQNPSFRALAIGTAFIVAGYATSISAINYMLLYVWQVTDTQIAYYPAGLAVVVMAAFLLVSPLHRRFGKRDTAVVGSVVAGLLTLATYSARNFGWWPEFGTNFSASLLLLCFTTALLAQVLCNISASSMVAEIVEDHESSHGQRREGLFYSAYLMIQKFGQAFGIFMVGQMIAFAGLEAKISPADLSPDIAVTLSWAYGVTIFLMALGASLFFRQYRIDRAGHEARLVELSAKKRQLSAQSN